MQPTLAPAPAPSSATQMRPAVVSFFSVLPRTRVQGTAADTSETEQESSADQHLRERLLAQGLNGGSSSGGGGGQTLSRIEQHHHQPHQALHPHDDNIDPAIAGSGMMDMGGGGGGAHSADGNQSDGKKGKRELSTSKRAAQNRAAQRAFRQRKEGHIKDLEAQVKDYNSLSESYKALQAENFQLRDYIITLQSRLIEAQGELPQPPSNIEINAQRPSPASAKQHASAPTAPMGSTAVSQLQASAARVIDLSSQNNETHNADRLPNRGPSLDRAIAKIDSEGSDGR
ncbi:MAG: hypothetical protein Q9219_000572 [cf. Caloplaca sp. 3 TL-2023]